MYNIDRDSYYIKIEVENNKESNRIVFSSFYVNSKGIKEDTEKRKIFYIEKDNSDSVQVIMENVIDLLYEESQKDDIFRYAKLKLSHKSIMLLRSHSTLIGCHSSIVEILSFFIKNGSIEKIDIKEETI